MTMTIITMMIQMKITILPATMIMIIITVIIIDEAEARGTEGRGESVISFSSRGEKSLPFISGKFVILIDYSELVTESKKRLHPGIPLTLFIFFIIISFNTVCLFILIYPFLTFYRFITIFLFITIYPFITIIFLSLPIILSILIFLSLFLS